MIAIEKLEIYNLEGAIRGMRNPLESWELSTSCTCDVYNSSPTVITNDGKRTKERDQYCHNCANFGKGCEKTGLLICEADLKLMHRLYLGGTEHRKFMRQIFVSMDITAPEYWWKEFDTYKVGVVRNSTSTMHRLTSKPFTKDQFSFENVPDDISDPIIKTLESLRREFIRTGNKQTWKELIKILPMSFNYLCTVTFNYENAASMILQRREHKLSEWRAFCKMLEKLPYMETIRKGISEEAV